MEDKQHITHVLSLSREKKFSYTMLLSVCVCCGGVRDSLAHELHAHPSLPLPSMVSTRERDNQRASFTARI